MASKSGGGGPEGILRWKIEDQKLCWENELPTILDKEVGAYHKLNYPEIDDVVETWFRVYHSLVLLVTAIDQPKSNKIWNYCGLEEDFYVGCFLDDSGQYWLENSHRVPAFYDQEAGCKGGWIYQKIKDDFDKRAKKLETYGKHFLNQLLQEIPKIDDPLQLQPALQYFLDRFKDLPPAFNRTVCLEACRQSISEKNASHDNTNQSVEMALARIGEIWGDHLESHLNEMRNLLNEPSPNTPAGSEPWLREEFQLSELEEPIAKLFERNCESINEDDRPKLEAISLETIKLQLNTTTYYYIYHRFVDADSDLTSKGLEEVINDISDNVEWQNLLAATYGAIAWQIYQQIQSSIEQVKQVIGGD